MAKQNARIVLKYSTVYPFRLRGKFMYCVYCSEQYDDPSTYRKHMDTNHKKFTISTAFAHCRQDTLKVDCTNLKCRICSEPFDRLEQVARHIGDQHSQKKLNLDFEIGLQPYKIDKDKWCCYICDHKLPSLVNLCRHTTSHYQKYACDICGKAYMKVEGLRYHIRCTHSGSHTCRKCWQKFPTLEAKREHAMTSQKCWTFCCVTCGERFKSWEFKQKHLLETHGVPQRTYNCPECSLVFQSRKVFYKHYKLTHTDEGFACPCCGVVFSTKRCLENHRVGHTGERQHICSVCSKAFTRASSLKQHMWIHSEMKRFSCLVCDNRVFSQKVSLKAHMKSYHPDVTVEF